MAQFVSLGDSPSLVADKQSSVAQLMTAINVNGLRGVCLADQEMNLVAFVTDGDLRRFLLAGGRLDDPYEVETPNLPVTTSEDTPAIDAESLMRRHLLDVIPVLRGTKIVGAWSRHLSIRPPMTDFLGIVMAGGLGQRMRPLTLDTPKPLMTVGSITMLDHILLSLRQAGISRVLVSVHYLAERIQEHVAKTNLPGMSIDTIEEQSPLGTAGGLTLIPDELEFENVLVVNGDVMFDGELYRLLDRHSNAENAITVGTTVHQIEVPFGVVQSEAQRLIGIEEKPNLKLDVASGINVISRAVLGNFQKNSRLDMPEVIQTVLQMGGKAEAFHLDGNWIDVGTPQALLIANEKWS